MNHTPQQTDVFSAIAEDKENLFLTACAGAGKTTTLVEGLKHVPRGEGFLPPQVAFLAFNKEIVETLRPRVGRDVTCSTFHSFGLRALRAAGMAKKVDARKAWKLAAKEMRSDDEDMRAVVRLVGLAKNTTAPEGMGPHAGMPDFSALVEEHDVELLNPTHALRVAERVFEASCRDTDTVDFDDMVFLPVRHGVAISQQDYIFVDEAQDLNTVQVEFLSRMGKTRGRGTRYIFVGDPRQAIYGFRGAGTDALSVLRSRFATRSLPLSVSFRCPRRVVLEARNRGFTEIQPWIDSPEGDVTTRMNYSPASFPVGSAILCRNTAPLIVFALQSYAHGVRAHVKGRDIGAGLCTLAKKLATTPEPFLDALDRWAGEQLSKKGNHSLVMDKAECLRVLWEKEKDISGLLRRVEYLFADNEAEGRGTERSALLLSTIHRAKGLEWKHVFFLDKNLLPSKYAVLPWQQEQERNLLYVAITRAQHTLSYISSGCWTTETQNSL